ncbi:Type II/IV secretion system protein TadC [Paramixta manurensis]|uniref:Type II/IV secretion system protein TadC n=1 Tax=Paramixta manurensis TaxID=2740817 RepID=A0A6M8UI97_9GAMM|nr:Type II/IV secretion system protein TadC [Erwiniaceae bacterium PD-1]
MNLVYLILLALGIYTIAISVLQQQKVLRQKKILEPLNHQSGKKVVATIDYHTLIIKNSRWLSLLDRLDKQLPLKLQIFCGVAGVIVLINLLGLLSLSMQGLGMLLMLGMVLVIVLPGILLKPSIKGRVKLMMDALPYLVDLVAVCVQSGMTVESALKFVSERFQHLDKNLASLMAVLVKRAEVSGMEEALSELYHSMEMTEIRMFTATLQQSVHYGTSLYEHLIELSQDIRELQLLITEEKVGSLSAKMSVPLIIFIMFPITILIVAPGILRIVKNGMF